MKGLWRGFYLRLSEEMDPAVGARIQAITESLLTDLPRGLTDLLPGYGSLYLEYDAAVVNEARLRRWLQHHLEAAGEVSETRTVEIPVRYDGEDLPEVARRAGLSPEEVIHHHSGTTYRVYAMGFSPGFPFMGQLPSEIRTPRHSSPRSRVPAHSVAIAGNQTGIYPMPSPGGWQLLGRALVKVYDPHREDPFLLTPGDSVRFVERDGEVPDDPAPAALLPEEPELPFLRVLEPGLLDLVVDRGRFIVGRFGLGRGGPLDPRSAALANALLGNDADAPLLELNARGPTLEAVAPGVASFAGWGLVPELNGEALAPFASFALRRGDVLSFAASGGGCRGYLAVAGGLAANSFAGSASADLKGLIGTPLASGDLLGRAGPSRARAGFSFTPYRMAGASDRSKPVVLRLLPGPQPSTEAVEALVSGAAGGVFRIATADRLGLRLEGNEVPGGEVLSEGVPIGAIQVPPSGKPILLLNDRGTMGGYVKPAVVHPADLYKAGQLPSGSLVRFVWSGARN